MNRGSSGGTPWVALRDRVLEKVAQAVPGQAGAMIDRLRPGLEAGFGGPFNGQERRTEAIREMFESVSFRSVIETGTYRATTTLFLSQLADAPVATIEVNSRYYHYSRRRLENVSNVTLIRGDSAAALRSLAKRSPWTDGPSFFYLDAHWHRHLPLPAELAAILAGWQDFAILIDDFRVPTDPGYAFDDYGPGNSLEPAMLAPHAADPVVIYWPAAPSGRETGARRGWVVLASTGRIDDALRPLVSMRRGGPISSVVPMPRAARAL